MRWQWVGVIGLLILIVNVGVAADSPLGIDKLPTTEKVLALTFDAHDEAKTEYGADQILKILARNHIHCTFFVTGKFVEDKPELVWQILLGGNEIGNHTYNHAYVMPDQETKERLTEELQRTKEIYREKIGLDMMNYWRAPYGNVSSKTMAWARETGFFHVGWTVDMRDWVTDKKSKIYASREQLLQRFEDFIDRKDAGGDIILCHLQTLRETDNLDTVLQEMIDYAHQKGFRFVKISEITGEKQEVPSFPDNPGSNPTRMNKTGRNVQKREISNEDDSGGRRMGNLTEQEISKERWKYYVLLLAWPFYLLILPYCFVRLGWVGVLFLLFPGVYLYTWVGCLLHEAWHGYVPQLPNKLLFHVFSWMLLLDPQLFDLTHGYHHSNVNTWHDFELHPLGEIDHPLVRRMHHGMEIVLGVGYITAVFLMALPLHPQLGKGFRYRSLLLSIAVWLFFLGGLAVASYITFNVSLSHIILAYILIFWLGSVMSHHSRLIEHGRVIATGNFGERNFRTRNLKASGVLESVFLFLTHGDAEKHLLHHLQPQVYTRPFQSSAALPEGAVIIDFRDYLKILWEMLAEKKRSPESGVAQKF